MKFKSVISLLVGSLFITGCDVIEDHQITDQCMRVDLFQSCLQHLPSGPQATHYNDWSEVVKECESAAFWQSQRNKRQVKQECQPV